MMNPAHSYPLMNVVLSPICGAVNIWLINIALISSLRSEIWHIISISPIWYIWRGCKDSWGCLSLQRRMLVLFIMEIDCVSWNWRVIPILLSMLQKSMEKFSYWIVIKVSGGPIVWQSRRQTMPSLSTTTAELVALYNDPEFLRRVLNYWTWVSEDRLLFIKTVI